MGGFTFGGSHGTRMTKTVSIMKRCVDDKLERRQFNKYLKLDYHTIMFVSAFPSSLNIYQSVKAHSVFCLDTKGITFGRRSNKLDLYHPPNVGRSEEVPAPLVVYIFGGAWGSGDRSIYCLLARQMAEELGATVICPDYCTYPKVGALEK